MNNLMVKDMTRRYAEYLHTGNLEERGGKIIYFWVMSTLESFFWGLWLTASFEADLYASEQKIFLVPRDPTGKEHEFVHYPTYNCDNGKLPIMLQNFVEIFNNIEYPLSDKISSPVFRAYNSGTWEHPYNRKKYNGYYHISIFVDMLPDADDDPANHGKYA